MRDIALLARKLRAAADLLDDLLVDTSKTYAENETQETAERIRASFQKPESVWTEEPQGDVKPRGPKGFKYKPGTHWTQKPENRKKLARVAKVGHKIRAAKSAQAIAASLPRPGSRGENHWTQKLKAKREQQEKQHHKGLHWTQRPENRAKVQATVEKGTRTRQQEQLNEAKVV